MPFNYTHTAVPMSKYQVSVIPYNDPCSHRDFIYIEAHSYEHAHILAVKKMMAIQYKVLNIYRPGDYIAEDNCLCPRDTMLLHPPTPTCKQSSYCC